MSHEIPVFTFAVNCSEVRGRSLTWDEAGELMPKEYWMSTSRNWWYQGLVKNLLDAYAGFEELRYLTEIVAVVETEQLSVKADAITGLIKSIQENTAPFARALWKHASDEEVSRMVGEFQKYLTEGEVSRHFNDDCIYAYGNFFSFLVTQIAALNEARGAGKCLVYFQPQP